MGIFDFILDVIPLRFLQEKADMGQLITRADIARIVDNTPINWAGQDYTAEEIIDEITANKGLYVNMLTTKDIEAMKDDYLEYMQDHNSTDYTGSRVAAGKVAFDYANAKNGATYAAAMDILHKHYDYLEKHEPGKLTPNL